MTVDYAAIGTHLAALRKERGLSIQDVSERAAIIAHKLRAIECGGKQPTLGDLHALAKAYGVYLEVGIGALSVRAEA
jgi:transcriptional regulator with XRE-family HTH domain